MRFFTAHDSRSQRNIQYWRLLGFTLILLLMTKQMLVQINFWTEDTLEVSDIMFAANSPYRIHINLDAQMMYVYREEYLHRTYPVSGGRKKYPSPVGEWRIIHKDTWGSGYGGSWMGLDVPWGVYGIHGTLEPWAVGQQNISHGCIRMKNEDAKELYQFIPYGTKVTIVHDGQPFRNLKDGDVGSDVYQVQVALKLLGYYQNSVDGRYGAGTRQAVLAYQKDVKLSQTGIVNINTWEKLMAQYEESTLESFGFYHGASAEDPISPPKSHGMVGYHEKEFARFI